MASTTSPKFTRSASWRRGVAACAAVIVGLCVALTETAPVAGSAAISASGRQASVWGLPPPGPPPGGKPLLAAAVSDLTNGQAARALPVFNNLTSDPAIGGYALLYAGRAEMALNRSE